MAGKKAKRKQVHVKTPFSSPKHPPSHPPVGDPEVGLCSSNVPDAAPAPSPSSGDAPSKMCRHLEKGVDVDKLSSQVSKAKFTIIHCQFCAKESKSGTGKKGKGRSNRKKEIAMTAGSAAHLQKKWVCLACGHVACGAVTASNKKSNEQEGSVQSERLAPSGHVCKHSLCSRHPLALQTLDDLVWCFMCNMAVDPGDSQLSCGESSLQAAFKIVHEKLKKETHFLKDPGKEGSTGDLIECHVGELTQADSGLHPSMSLHVTGARRKRMIKGLMNLGNTCFFNSVMQNLLALDMLRDYFSQDLPGMEGPLTSSLRKLYLETNVDGTGQLCTNTSESSGYESGLKKGVKGRATWETSGGVCNPRSLFGAICAKAPRFRGFQQQDSHELLRCLLDGLSSEERSVRAKSNDGGDIKKGTNDPITNQSPAQTGESVSGGPPEGEKECPSSDGTFPSPAVTTTVVESLFGGQLCSTVCCCECGHSSVVFEPMLDLSLQIPSPKKSQTRASQSKLLSSRGESQERHGKQTSSAPNIKSYNVPRTAGGLAAVDISKTSLQGGQSSQTASTPVSSPAGAGSPRQATVDNSSDDFGWLDFISGGMQSAESSLQGSCDVPNTIEVSESNLAVDLKEYRPAIIDTVASISSSVKAEVEVVKEAIESTSLNAKDQGKRSDMDRLEAEIKVATSLGSEIEKGLSLSESDDGPLPLASGIVLLPYEPLEMSSTSTGVQSVAYVKSDPECTLLEETSGPLTEPEASYLDGFSELFDEEESYYAPNENVKSTFSNVEDSQVIGESAQDDGDWEVDTTVQDRGEVEAASQCLPYTEDAFLPMSLEGCLADFTKPELLNGENAWECESCTKRVREKSLSVRCGETMVKSEPTKDMNGGKDYEKPAYVPPEEDDSKCLINCTENGVPEQSTPEDCKEYTSEGNMRSIEGESCVHPVVYYTSVESQNGFCHSNKLNEGWHPVSGFPLSQADGKMDIIKEIQLTAENGAHIPILERSDEGNTSVHSSAFKPSMEEGAQEGCCCVNCSCSANKRNLTTSQCKSMKEVKSKTKCKQSLEKLVKKDATKRLSISKAPPILTVHLKRFAQDLRGRLSKLSGHVSFPEILDLRPFLDSRCQDSGNCFYQLVGVVEHGGTMRAGHYIAYVRSAGLEEAIDGAEQESKDVWYYVSDSSVHKASLQAVLNSEAYLLFYEKCNVTREN